jgi:hypothetical protein
MTASSPGERKRRQAKRERDRSAYHSAMMALRAAGRSCGSCQHFGHARSLGKRCCELDSDFEGYVIRTADELCPRWAAQRGG